MKADHWSSGPTRPSERPWETMGGIRAPGKYANHLYRMESGLAFSWHRVLETKMSHWQTPELSRTFLEGVRGAIPACNLQIEVLLKIISAWRPSPASVLDLGCGDGILGRALLERFSPSDLVFLDFSDTMLEAAGKKVPTGGR